MLKELILKNRSYRRFRQDIPIAMTALEELTELARFAASGSNMQPLKYVLSCDPEMNARIYEDLTWAGYLKDWPGPKEGERPSAYILLLGDRSIAPTTGCDHGIAAQNILLGAVEKGLGGCMIGSIRRSSLSRALELDERFEIVLAIALGVPAERVILENAEAGGTIKYWRDAESAHHVPKRPLDELILKRYPPARGA